MLQTAELAPGWNLRRKDHRLENPELPRSAEMSRRSYARFPGGAHGYIRGDQDSVGLTPIISHGRGANVWDVDHALDAVASACTTSRTALDTGDPRPAGLPPVRVNRGAEEAMTGNAHRFACRFCSSTAGDLVLDLGAQPAADHFPPADDPGPDPTHPLRMWMCARCRLAQLVEDPTSADEPRGTEPEVLVRQAHDAVDAMAAAGFLEPGRTVVEFGSPHGGSWMDLLTARGLRPAGEGEPVDVLVDNIGIMHDADQAAALAARVGRLAPDGILLIQFHSLASILRGGQWNALRHGHFAYYSTPALVGMLETVGLRAVRAFWYPIYGGTVLLAATRGGVPDGSVVDLVADELSAGVTDPAVLRGLSDAARAAADDLAGFLAAERAAGRTVLGYSAASRAVALLNRAGIGPDLLPAVADSSAAKQGRRPPGSGVPVIAPEELLAARPDGVVLFVEDLLPEVRAAYPEIEERGGRWIVADAPLTSVIHGAAS